MGNKETKTLQLFKSSHHSTRFVTAKGNELFFSAGMFATDDPVIVQELLDAAEVNPMIYVDPDQPTITSEEYFTPQVTAEKVVAQRGGTGTISTASLASLISS